MDRLRESYSEVEANLSVEVAATTFIRRLLRMVAGIARENDYSFSLNSTCRLFDNNDTPHATHHSSCCGPEFDTGLRFDSLLGSFSV